MKITVNIPESDYREIQNRLLHAEQSPAEYHQPKCRLFDEWLPERCQKYEKCLKRIKEVN